MYVTENWIICYFDDQTLVLLGTFTCCIHDSLALLKAGVLSERQVIQSSWQTEVSWKQLRNAFLFTEVFFLLVFPLWRWVIEHAAVNIRPRATRRAKVSGEPMLTPHWLC